jgi:hypothetical protein
MPVFAAPTRTRFSSFAQTVFKLTATGINVNFRLALVLACAMFFNND